MAFPINEYSQARSHQEDHSNLRRSSRVPINEMENMQRHLNASLRHGTPGRSRADSYTPSNSSSTAPRTRSSSPEFIPTSASTTGTTSASKSRPSRNRKRYRSPSPVIKRRRRKRKSTEVKKFFTKEQEYFLAYLLATPNTWDIIVGDPHDPKIRTSKPLVAKYLLQTMNLKFDIDISLVQLRNKIASMRVCLERVAKGYKAAKDLNTVSKEDLEEITLKKCHYFYTLYNVAYTLKNDPEQSQQAEIGEITEEPLAAQPNLNLNQDQDQNQDHYQNQNQSQDSAAKGILDRAAENKNRLIREKFKGKGKMIVDRNTMPQAVAPNASVVNAEVPVAEVPVDEEVQATFTEAQVPETVPQVANIDSQTYNADAQEANGEEEEAEEEEVENEAQVTDTEAQLANLESQAADTTAPANGSSSNSYGLHRGKKSRKEKHPERYNTQPIPDVQLLPLVNENDLRRRKKKSEETEEQVKERSELRKQAFELTKILTIRKIEAQIKNVDNDDAVREEKLLVKKALRMKAEAEARKAEAEARKAEAEALKAEMDVRKAEAEVQVAQVEAQIAEAELSGRRIRLMREK
ncbi:hypothetical protein BGZ76_010926 [Entomortierella beljakovae]|nr:hypothetical protein BGZ76_010926 [Entomortierella beljakovae]